MMNEDLNEWFIQNILAHEKALVRFLARAWPNASEVRDLSHEIYARVLEAAASSRPTSPRGFLFATARHLMADRVRRGKVVSIELQDDLDSLNVLIDELSPERQLGARQDLWELARSFEELPPSCRDILWMVKVEELTQKQIAAQLGLTVRAVEKRLASGLKLLRQACLQQAQSTARRGARVDIKGRPQHG